MALTASERCARWRRKNPERARQVDRTWQAENRDKVRAAGARWRAKYPGRARASYLGYQRKKREFVSWLKSLPCLDCGGTFLPCAMQFDHRPGEGKRFEMKEITRRLDDLQAEIMKCDLVCANCHAVRTWRRQQK